METILVNIKGREIQADAPAGFWEQSPELRIAHIQAKWPQANWAGNGGCGMFACHHHLTPIAPEGSRNAVVALTDASVLPAIT